MIRSKAKQNAHLAVLSILALTLILTPAPQTDAADHRDAPLILGSESRDIADVYLFLDPGDNTRAIIALTTSGFIVPGEIVAQAFLIPPAGTGSRSRIQVTPNRTTFLKSLSHPA